MKFVSEEMFKKNQHFCIRWMVIVLKIYTYLLQERKILLGLYRICGRMLEQGLRNQFWIAMNEEDGVFVDLYPKQSYDLSSEDLRRMNHV